METQNRNKYHVLHTVANHFSNFSSSVPFGISVLISLSLFLSLSFSYTLEYIVSAELCPKALFGILTNCETILRTLAKKRLSLPSISFFILINSPLCRPSKSLSLQL